GTGGRGRGGGAETGGAVGPRLDVDRRGAEAQGRLEPRHTDATFTRSATASATSRVEARPPRSGVRRSLAPDNTAATLASTRRAASAWPRSSSIIAPARIVASGFATPRPPMSGAEP